MMRHNSHTGVSSGGAASGSAEAAAPGRSSRAAPSGISRLDLSAAPSSSTPALSPASLTRRQLQPLEAASAPDSLKPGRTERSGKERTHHKRIKKFEGKGYFRIKVGYPSPTQLSSSGEIPAPANHLCCLNPEGNPREDQDGVLHKCLMMQSLSRGSGTYTFDEVQIPLSDQGKVEGYAIYQSEVCYDPSSSSSLRPKSSKVLVLPMNPRSKTQAQSDLEPAPPALSSIPFKSYKLQGIISWHPEKVGVLGVLEAKSDSIERDLVRPWTRLRLNQWEVFPEGFEIKVGLAKLRLVRGRLDSEQYPDALRDYYVDPSGQRPQRNPCYFCQSDKYPWYNPAVANIGDIVPVHLSCLQNNILIKKTGCGKNISPEKDEALRERVRGNDLEGVDTITQLQNTFEGEWSHRAVNGGKYGQVLPVLNDLYRRHTEAITPPLPGTAFVISLQDIWKDRLTFLNTPSFRNDAQPCRLMGDLWVDPPSDEDDGMLVRQTLYARKLEEEEKVEKAKNIEEMRDIDASNAEARERLQQLRQEQSARVQDFQRKLQELRGQEKIKLAMQGPPKPSPELLQLQQMGNLEPLLPSPDYDLSKLKVPATAVEPSPPEGEESFPVSCGQVDAELELPMIPAPYVIFERRHKQEKGPMGDEWGKREEVRDVIVLPVRLESTYKIGRDPESHIVLNGDDTASRDAAEFRLNSQGQVEIRDIGSSYGILMRPQKGAWDKQVAPEWTKLAGGGESAFSEVSEQLGKGVALGKRMQMKGYVYDLQYVPRAEAPRVDQPVRARLPRGSRPEPHTGPAKPDLAGATGGASRGARAATPGATPSSRRGPASRSDPTRSQSASSLRRPTPLESRRDPEQGSGR